MNSTRIFVVAGFLMVVLTACGTNSDPQPSMGSLDVGEFDEEVDISSDEGDMAEEIHVPACISDEDCLLGDDGDFCNGVPQCVDGECVEPNGELVNCIPPENPCLVSVCEPSSGDCVEEPGVDGVACDDGDLCTLGDGCTDGECVGQDSKDCDDGNECTLDSCLGDGECDHDFIEAACEDGNPCTVGDFCDDGDCQSGFDALDCNDDNPCTSDACSSVEGCIHAPNDKPCDDGDDCTLGDTCVSGDCVSGATNVCLCQSDTDCPDDDDLCNGSKICVEGLCETDPETVIQCPPEDVDPGQCIESICKPATGLCVESPIVEEVECDDGDACTDDDHCEAGECAGLDVDCDDDNPATFDFCAPETGECKHEEVVCDDGDSCTDDEVGPDGLCFSVPKNCDDQKDCTGDECVDGECVNTFVPAACNEDEPCAVWILDEVDNTCACISPVADCDDDNPCTLDKADVVNCQCIHQSKVCLDLCKKPLANDDGSCPCLPIDCDDDNACTNDSCNPLDGACQHTSIICEDMNPCTEDSCNPASGECVFESGPLDGTSCTDGDPCTAPDVCLNGECTSQPAECVEICDNDKDDDGDYKSDCQDVDCADFPACKEEEDECVPGSSMSCGMAQIGQVAADSDGIVDGYSCSEHSYPGGEEVYQFEAPCTGKMQVSLTVQSTPGNGAVIDLMLLDPDVGCKGSACVAAGLMSDGYVKQAKLSFEADSGEQFYVVVEGREGASGSFSLLATCSCN